MHSLYILFVIAVSTIFYSYDAGSQEIPYLDLITPLISFLVYWGKSLQEIWGGSGDYVPKVIALSIFILSAALIFSFKSTSTVICNFPHSAHNFSANNKQIISFISIMTIVLFTRFYAINLVPGWWDDEICFSRAISTSSDDIVMQQLGFLEPLASTGLIWNYIHFLNYKISGINFVDHKLIGAAISVINVLVFYFICRFFTGFWFSLFGMCLYAFSALDIGISRLPSWHGLPVLYGNLLLLLFLSNEFTPRRWKNISVILLCIATNGLYPSGTFLFMFVVIYYFYRSLDRSILVSSRFSYILQVVLCLAGWVFIRSIVYWLVTHEIKFVPPIVNRLTHNWLPGSATGQTSFLSLIERIPPNLELYLRSVFIEDPNTFPHWMPFSVFKPLTPVSTHVAIFAFIGAVLLLCTKNIRLILILFGFLLFSILPGLITEMDVRRVVGSFSVLTLLALLASEHFYRTLSDSGRRKFVATLFKTYGLLLCLWLFIMQISVYFSQPKGVPVDLKVSDYISSKIERNSVIVFAMERERFNCQPFYLNLEKFKDEELNIGMRILRINDFRPELLANAEVDKWFYKNTWLKTQIPKMKDYENIIIFSENEIKLNKILSDSSSMYDLAARDYKLIEQGLTIYSVQLKINNKQIL